jgi:release factor glutamine methyltransferase
MSLTLATIGAALVEGTQALQSEGEARPRELARAEAELLLSHVLGKGRAWLFAHGDAALDPEHGTRYAALIERRARGEPIAYLTGRREFWKLSLAVTPDVLIPRHETELLVEAALARIAPDAKARLVDLGTGSGALALALAHERPHCEVHGCDISAAALEVARINAQALGLERVRWHRGVWWAPLGGMRFALVVSNPPYLASADPHFAEGDLRFEPRDALAAGRDGLNAIRAILAGAPAHLDPGGWLLIEHGSEQGDAVRELFRAAGFGSIETLRDLEARQRVTLGRAN